MISLLCGGFASWCHCLRSLCGSIVVHSLFIVAQIVCGGSVVFGLYLLYAQLSALLNFAITLMEKRELAVFH